MNRLHNMLCPFLKQHLVYPFNNIPLRRKILLSNLVINIILVLVTSFWAAQAVYGQLLTQSSYSLQKSFDQALSFINTKLEAAVSLSDAVVLNTSLNGIINKEYNNVVDANTNARVMRQLVRSYESTDGITRVRIYVNDNWNLAVDGKNICPLSQLQDPKLLEQLFSKKGLKLFLGSGYAEDEPYYAQHILPMFRVMYSTDNYNEIAFILRIDMDKQDFVDILSNVSPTSDSLSFLVDSNHSVIASSGALDETALESSLDGLLQLPEGEQTDISLSSGKYLALRSDIALTDWCMVTLVPYSSFFMNFQTAVRLIFFAAILIILVSLILFSLISYSITRRILILCNHINETNSGELIPINAPDYKDEIGLLYRNYNQMIVRIRQLLRENYNIGRNLKNAEYKALQSQINPHFLYNTLDMISWFSLQQKTKEVNEVVYSLAHFYKISLSKGMDIISIGEEIELTDCYINIQKHRFSNRIQYITDIDPAICEYSIPKITIQPLVENAIFHGILEKKENAGTIELRGRMEDGIIHIMLSDDGKGMDSSSTILNGGAVSSSARLENPDGPGSHYGLKNIVLRLKLLYGPEYGLSIESECGKGTVIHLHIPALTPGQVSAGEPRV